MVRDGEVVRKASRMNTCRLHNILVQPATNPWEVSQHGIGGARRCNRLAIRFSRHFMGLESNSVSSTGKVIYSEGGVLHEHTRLSVQQVTIQEVTSDTAPPPLKDITST